MNKIPGTDPISQIKSLIMEFSTKFLATNHQIRGEGTISPQICENCPNKEIMSTKVLDRPEYDPRGFVDWMETHGVSQISASATSIDFYAESSPILGLKGQPHYFRNQREYHIKKSVKWFQSRVSEELKPFFVLEFDHLDFCDHVQDPASLKQANPLLLTLYSVDVEIEEPQEYALHKTKLQRLLESDQERPVTTRLFLACTDCARTLPNKGCRRSIVSEGFLYSHDCPLENIIFVTLAREKGIDLTDVRSAKFHGTSTITQSHGFGYFSRTLKTLFTTHRLPEADLLEVIKPEIVVSFSQRHSIVHLLHLNTDFIITANIHDDPLTINVYDRNLPVDKDIDNIVTIITQKLVPYSTELVGKEHDRLITAFKRIGSDLGYQTGEELMTKTSRVDVAWFDNTGKVVVAIEIETSSSWKKDVLSTWELEPEIAIILCHYKTTRGIDNILDYPLTEHLPHKLLFINNSLGNIYLIDKNKLIKTYTYSTEK